VGIFLGPKFCNIRGGKLFKIVLSELVMIVYYNLLTRILIEHFKIMYFITQKKSMLISVKYEYCASL